MQRTYYERPHESPPIYPSGANGLESRVKAIEVHLWHEAQRNRATQETAHQAHDRINSLENSITTVVHKVGLWVIVTLGTTTVSLGLVTLKYMFPGQFP